MLEHKSQVVFFSSKKVSRVPRCLLLGSASDEVTHDISLTIEKCQNHQYHQCEIRGMYIMVQRHCFGGHSTELHWIIMDWLN